MKNLTTEGEKDFVKCGEEPVNNSKGKIVFPVDLDILLPFNVNILE